LVSAHAILLSVNAQKDTIPATIAISIDLFFVKLPYITTIIINKISKKIGIALILIIEFLL
jgi:hypothetical protein